VDTAVHHVIDQHFHEIKAGHLKGDVPKNGDVDRVSDASAKPNLTSFLASTWIGRGRSGAGFE